MKRTASRVFTIHDVSKGPAPSTPHRQPTCKDAAGRIPLNTPTKYGHTNRKVGSPKTATVFSQATVFGVRTRV